MTPEEESFFIDTRILIEQINIIAMLMVDYRREVSTEVRGRDISTIFDLIAEKTILFCKRLIRCKIFNNRMSSHCQIFDL